MGKKIARKIVKCALYIFMKVVYRVKAEGLENIPKEGAFVLCGNHIHALDSVGLIATCKRNIRFLGKAELYESGFLRFLGHTFDAIPIKRGEADMDALKQSINALKKGDILGIYPEGTRNGMAKKVELKTGAAFLALKTDSKIIPVGVKGSFKPFTKVYIKYGEPMDFSQYNAKKPEKAVLEKVTNEAMNRVQELAK